MDKDTLHNEGFRLYTTCPPRYAALTGDKISYHSVRQMVINGDLPAIRLGRNWYFTESCWTTICILIARSRCSNRTRAGIASRPKVPAAM